MKLERKIAIIILQIALIPWVIAGVITYLSAQEQIHAKTYTDLSAVADLQKHWLQNTIQNKLDMLSLFSNDPQLVALFYEYRRQPTLLAQKKVLEYLTGEMESAKSVQKVFIATPVGTVVASTDQALLGTDVSAEEYFKLGLHANNASTLKKNAAGVLTQYLTGPLMVRGQLEGVVVVVSDARDVISISEQYAVLGNTGEMVLVKKTDNGGALFLTPTRFDPSAALTRVVPANQVTVPAPHAAAGEESIFTNAVDYRGVKVFAATRYIDSVDWGLVVKIDQSEALAPIRKLGELFALVIIIAGLLMVFISISISRSITKPINRLTQFVRKVAKEGSLNQSILVTTNDEVGMLGVSFNNMILRLQESHASLETKVTERTRELALRTEEAKNNERAALNIAADLKDEEEKLNNEKIKAENLARDLEKFKLALDNSSDLVIITDTEGIIAYVNQAVEKITGYLPKEAIGKKAGMLWKLPMPDDFYKNLWHTIKDQKKIFIGEIQNRRRNGEIYTALINIFPVLDKDGNILFFVAVQRDITKEKEIDKAKNEFISLASHQMRTPLTTINWYAEMLLDGDAGELTVKQNEYFKSIYTAAKQMNDILKSFLHILRLETGKIILTPVAVDVEDVTRATIKELQLEIEKKHIRIVERYQEPLPMVMMDKEIIQVILQNLISNAVKYSLEQGEITISLEAVKRGVAAAGKVAIQDSFFVSVKDAGIGIPAGDYDKIFMKFFRSENAKKLDPNGNGIGLYMVNKMAAILGGSIWFDSELGRGTTFYALLPISRGKTTDTIIL